MSEEVSREIHVYLKNGSEIFIGRARLSDEDVGEIMNIFRSSYENDGRGSFSLNSSVFDINALAGVSVRPPAKI